MTPIAPIAPVQGGPRLARHEIPTHLNVEDRVALGLSLRQVLYLLVGLASAYGAWNQWEALPDGVRVALATGCLVFASAVALCRPGQRGLDEWAIVILRYTTVPKRAVWRARAVAVPTAAARLFPDAEAESGAWEELPRQLWRPA